LTIASRIKAPWKEIGKPPTKKSAALIAQAIVAKGLSVRDAERLAQQKKAKRFKTARLPREKDADTRAPERDLTAKLGLKAEISFDGKAA
jgi:ParB family chromosome partitioning protein